MNSKEKALESGNVFTSVGNAWILCRSKTYRGRVYYFNTLTGKTAWNLSDAEMERAQRRANENVYQEGTSTQNCPEPTEPPDQNFERNHWRIPSSNKPAKVYNKQIINNQFSKSPLEPFVPSQCSNCNPMQNFASQSSAFNNRSMWTLPQTHPILITPAAPPMIYQQPPTFNIPSLLSQNIPPPNTAVAYTNDNANWENKTPVSIRYPKKYNQNKWNNTRTFQQRYNTVRKFDNRNKAQDLREVLAGKRKKSHFNPETECEPLEENIVENELVKQNSTQTEDCVSSSQDTFKDELYPSDVDEEWLEENTHYQGAKPLINITPIISLRNSDSRSDCWYIVVDTTVLLNNLDFLNVLANSDDNCLLMTPQCTMEELKIIKETGSAQEKKRSRRAMVFLSQQINSGCAFIGEDVYQDDDFGNHEALICCLFLAKQNNFAIMLSNNPEVIQYDNKVPFQIFTIPSLKEFLITSKLEIMPENLPEMPNQERSSPENEDVFPNRPLTVTIDNDYKNNSMDETAIFCERETVSIAVQTDIDDTNLLNTKWFSPSLQNLSALDDTSKDKHVALDMQQNFEPPDNAARTSDSQNINTDDQVALSRRRREIRLKRFVSHQEKSNEAPTETKEKKQFKWHRRRNKSCSETVSKIDLSKDVVNKEVNTEVETREDNCELDQQSANKSESGTPIKQNGNVSLGSDIAVNSETSYSYVPRRNADDRVVVEETSASGVMSTSASIADSEVMNDTFKSPKNNSFDRSRNATCGITSLFMEDNLRRKSDEWVSRFTQIMEDILTEVLQQDPSFVDSKMLPPWTMHEAVECIKKKFHTHFDVVDACSKLSSMLSKVSNAKGVINKNMSPINFMEMYSYGVYLIDTLLNLNYNEDLLLAADSLSELKRDIQDPGDTTHNDSFTDNLNDLSINVVEKASTPKVTIENERFSSPKQVPSEQTVLDSPSSSKKKYNLRSNRIENQEEIDKQEVQFIKKFDKEMTFFGSLQLQKKEISSQESLDKSCSNKNKDTLENSNTVETNISKGSNKNITSPTEPKIIRNFTQCLEFEKKLKFKEKETLDYDHLDYDESNEQDNYGCNDNSFDNNLFEDDKNDCPHEVYQNEDSYYSDFSNTDSFKIFIGQLWCEIKDIFSTVHTFCVDTIEDLHGSSQLTHSKIMQIKYQAEEARVHINNLCEALVNIKLDDIQSQDYSVQDVLRRAGIEIDCDVMMDNEQFLKFRDIVAKCTAQADILLESLRVIFKSIPI